MSGRINSVYWVGMRIHVLMQAQRIFVVAFIGVLRQEPADLWPIVAGAQVVHLQRGVVLLTAVLIRIDSCACPRNGVAEGIVGVGIGDGAGVVEQLAYRRSAIVPVVTHRTRAALTDSHKAVSVLGGHSADDLLRHLRGSRGILTVY